MASKRFSRLVKILSGAAADAEDEIFLLDDRLERFVHFWVLVIRQFVRHRCLVRASALSYSTLIAIIPLLAVALSLTSSLLKNQGEASFERAVENFVAGITPPANISTNFVRVNFNSGTLATTNPAPNETAGVGAETNLTASVTNAVPPPEARVVTVSAQKEIARQIWSLVQNMQGVTIGATGVVLLVFVAISLLSRIEETFNDIWGVTRGRNWLRQVPIYCTTIVFGPVLLIAAVSLAGGAQFQAARDFITQMPVVGKFIFDLLPLLVMWLAFTLVYQMVPNTKVKFSAALVGGAVAGLLWHLNNVFGYLYVSRVFTNISFYGSLGLVPVFMIGLYFSWVFLLLGAQVAYAFQNRAAYLQDRLADNVNQRGREFVALRLMTCLGQRFQIGQPPATVHQLSLELGIPSRLTQSVLRTLGATRLVTEVAGAEAAFVPARPLDAINAYDILQAMRTGTGQELPLRDEPALAEIYGEFARIEKAEREAASHISMLTLVHRMTVPAALPAPEPVEVKKVFPAAPLAEKISEPEIIQPPAPEPEPEKTEIKIEPPEPSPEIIPPRRAVVMPDENREFPL
jgi:membrane protein